MKTLDYVKLLGKKVTSPEIKKLLKEFAIRPLPAPKKVDDTYWDARHTVEVPKAGMTFIFDLPDDLRLTSRVLEQVTFHGPSPSRKTPGFQGQLFYGAEFSDSKKVARPKFPHLTRPEQNPNLKGDIFSLKGGAIEGTMIFARTGARIACIECRLDRA